MRPANPPSNPPTNDPAFLAFVQEHCPGIDLNASASPDDISGLEEELNRELGDKIAFEPDTSGYWIIFPNHEGPMGSFLTAAEIDRLSSIVKSYGFSVERKVTGYDALMTWVIYEQYVVPPVRKLDVLLAEYQKGRGI